MPLGCSLKNELGWYAYAGSQKWEKQAMGSSNSRPRDFEPGGLTLKKSPPQTEEERRLIAEWLANPDNYARMMQQKQHGAAFCDAPATGLRANYDKARERGVARWRMLK